MATKRANLSVLPTRSPRAGGEWQYGWGLFFLKIVMNFLERNWFTTTLYLFPYWLGGTFFRLFLCIKNTSSVCFFFFFLGLVAGWAGCRVVAKIFEVLLMCCNEPEMRGWVITHKLLECFMGAQKKLVPVWPRGRGTGTGRVFSKCLLEKKNKVKY